MMEPAPDPSAAWTAARNFEAVALGEFLAPMFAGTDLSASPFGGGEAEQTWQSMFVTELGKQVERSGGLGIAQTVYATILRMQEAEQKTGSSP
jgi:Rod binding domain-containing protein